MMRIKSLWHVVVLGLILAPSPAFCLTPALVEQAKKATALVELAIGPDRKGYGSAFCVDASGLFITNAHVIGDGDVTGKIHLILSPGDADQRVAEVTVVTSDKELDLAVLRIDAPGHVLPLELGQVTTLYDTMEVTAFGYPFGGAMALQAHEYPAVSVNTGHVTSLRKKAGVLELVQLDAVLNPGNSGGPVLDAQGHVIGIVQAGLPGAGINFAIPVSRLQTMLVKPIVSVSPGSIPYDKRSVEQQITVTVTSMTRPLPKYNVELSLRSAGMATRTFAASAAAGSATFAVAPVPTRVGPRSVFIAAKFSGGSVVGQAADREIKVGTTPVKLDSIRYIERRGAGEFAIGATDGSEKSGRVSGLESVALNLGDATVSADLSRATRIDIENSDMPVRSLAYTVSVRVAGSPVGETSGIIELTGAPEGAVDPGDVVVAGAGPPSSKGVELTTLVKPAENTRSGSWNNQSGLVSSGRGAEVIAIPYTPGDEYDLVAEFTRLSGDEDIAIVLRANGSRFMFVMGGWHNHIVGADMVGNKRADTDPASIKGNDLIPIGRKTQVTIKVRKGRLDALVNGQLAYHMTTDYAGWSLNGDWRAAQGCSLGLATLNSSVKFHSIRLTNVTGTGKPE